MKRLLCAACLPVMMFFMLFPAAMGAGQAEVILSGQQILQINAALADESKELPIDEHFRVHVKADDLSVVEGLDEDWMNILLLGTDTGNIRLNYGRTDAMLVFSINTRTGRVKLTSLVRDMLVEIPVYRFMNRINTANAFGGPMLAMKTVNEVLGLNIERYCSVNFNGFEDIVDYLGGVSLVLSGAEAGIVKARHTKEPQVLTGEQALKYVRIRQLDNNFGRNERQRIFLTSLLAQVKQSSLSQLLAAVSAGLKLIATNLTAVEIIALLPTLLRSADAMETLSLPQAGAYTYARTSAGDSVVEFDNDAARNAFHEFVYGY